MLKIKRFDTIEVLVKVSMSDSQITYMVREPGGQWQYDFVQTPEGHKALRWVIKTMKEFLTGYRNQSFWWCQPYTLDGNKDARERLYKMAKFHKQEDEQDSGFVWSPEKPSLKNPWSRHKLYKKFQIKLAEKHLVVQGGLIKYKERQGGRRRPVWIEIPFNKEGLDSIN